MKDQGACVLNDLEELGDKEFLILTLLTGQYSVEIFSCCLRLLPSCSSTHHQTNIESTQIGSEDHLLVSRIWSPRLLLEVILHDGEECLFFLPLGMLDRTELLVQYQFIFFQECVVLEDEQVVEGLLGCALAFDRPANANSSDFVSEVSCSLSSYSLSIKSVTNLFNPWDILTHEWELSLCTDSILFSTPYLPCRQQDVPSNTGPILAFPRIQPFWVSWFSSRGRTYSRHVTGAAICKNSSVSFVVKYCPAKTIFRKPASV